MALKKDRERKIQQILDALSIKRASQLPAPPEKEEKTPMNPVAAAISAAYTLDALKKIYPLYLKQFADEKSLNIRGTFNVSKLKKADLVSVFATVFSSAAAFNRFLTYLPKDVRKILDILVWEGGEHAVEKFQKLFGSEIMIWPEKNAYQRYGGEVRPPYLLFQSRQRYGYKDYEYSLYLGDEMQKLFQKYMEPPNDYHLNPVEKAEAGFFFQDKGKILNQIILFISYIQQGNLRFSKNGDKVLITSVRQMTRYCNIDEFYPDSKDKDIQNLRTQMLTDFLLSIPDAQFDDPLALMKQIKEELFTGGSRKTFKLRDLLWHLKGVHNFTGGYNDQSHEKYESSVRQSLVKLLRRLPLEKWLSLDNISRYCLYRNPEFDIIRRPDANRYLYYKVAGEEKYYGDEKISVSAHKYNDALLIPFIKGFFFLCAGLGLADIAYDLPENELHQDKGKNYLSAFDGLKYVRLSEPGAHLLGLKPDYKVKIEEESARIVLDEQRLFIHLEGKDSLKSLALEKMADKISPGCFRVSYQSFLKECSSKQDIRQKIRMFREQVSAEPPQIWKDFISDIMNKINPLSLEKTMKVYQLKPNGELISLIAKDEILKKYILKAEDYRIVIDSKHLSKVRSRLEEFGYFIDQL